MLKHIEVGGRVTIVFKDVVISAEITGVRGRDCRPADASCGDAQSKPHKEPCCDDVPTGPTICIETAEPVCVDRSG